MCLFYIILKIIVIYCRRSKGKRKKGNRGKGRRGSEEESRGGGG